MRRVLLAVAAAALLGGGCGEGAGAPAELAIGIRYSRFVPEMVTAQAGVPVRITLANDDPIAHEWIVGVAEVHERHRTGSEPVHDSVPTEVTVEPYARRVTTVTFVAAGDYEFVCHLPGHEAYGMRGVLRVR
jgi:uncharacterized cupredoxin-like copper-binding protein